MVDIDKARDQGLITRDEAESMIRKANANKVSEADFIRSFPHLARRLDEITDGLGNIDL